MKLKTISCFFILVLFTGTVKAQFTIQGKITDSTGAPIFDGAVVLQNISDSSIIKTAIPDSGGYYSILTNTLTNVIIKTSAIGFSGQVKNITDTTSLVQEINFILIQQNNLLQEVTVSSAAPLFERKTDRTIFHVSNSVTAIGGNALDAIKKSPGVVVREQSNSISLAGKSSVFVLINDRLIQFSGEDLIAYLQSIPAENIDREIITAPPAKYDATGNSGLINVVLKKNNKNGLNGAMRAGYQQATYGTALAGANVNYRKNNLNFYSNASYSDGSTNNQEKLITYFPEQEFQLSDSYKKTIRSVQYTVGLDYQLHKNGIVGIEFTGNSFRRTDVPGLNLKMIQRNTGNVDSTIITRGMPLLIRNNNMLNTNYVWTIDTTGKKLTINANKLWYTSNRNRAYETINYYGDFGAATGINNKNQNVGEQQIKITTTQADAELPYKWANISFGGKLSFIKNDSRNKFFVYKNNVYEEDNTVSNSFNYEEKVQALYINLQRELGKWSFQSGLRAEATETKGYSLNLNQLNVNQYFSLFPTVYIQYKPNENHVLNISYSKRINRPGYSDLDPFRFYNSPYSYVSGNPFLKPSFNHNLELNYTFRNNYNFSLFYQYEKDHFGQVFFADSFNKETYVTRANFGNNIIYGISAAASLHPFKWWNVEVQGAVSVQQINSDYYQQATQEYSLPGAYINMNNNFSLNKSKTLLAELNVFYQSKNQWDLFYWEPRGSVDTGIKAMLLDKQLIISLNANDLFATQQGSGINQATGQMFDGYFDVRNVRLMVNYKFGNKNVKARRERSSGIEEEKSRT